MLVFLRVDKPAVPPVVHHGITRIRSSFFGCHKKSQTKSKQHCLELVWHQRILIFCKSLVSQNDCHPGLTFTCSASLSPSLWNSMADTLLSTHQSEQLARPKFLPRLPSLHYQGETPFFSLYSRLCSTYTTFHSSLRYNFIPWVVAASYKG